MKNEIKSARKKYIDVARGIAIISIILGHLKAFEINRIVFTFHVPIFFLIAGAFFRENQSLIDLIKTRFKTLIVPYITACVGIIISAIMFNQIVREGVGDKATLVYWLKAAVYGAGTSVERPAEMPVIGAIWFLLALFWSNIFMYYIGKTNRLIAITSMLIVLAASCYSAQIYWLPFSIQAGGAGLFYMYLGYLGRDFITEKKNLSRLQLVAVALISFAIWISFVMQFKYFRMVCCNFEHWYDLIRSLAGCVVLLLLSKIIDDKLPAVTIRFAEIGRYSIVILCLHIIELNTFPYILALGSVGIKDDSSAYLWITAVIKLVLCIGGMKLIVKSSKARKLFGLG